MDSSEDAKFVTKNILKDDLASWYAGYATTVIRRHRVEESNIEVDDARWIMRSVFFATNKALVLTDEDSLAAEIPSQTSRVTAGERIARFAPAIYQYVLWFMVLFGSMMLMTGTIEEKSTKLVEVLLSNVDASQLMDGKITGSCVYVAHGSFSMAYFPLESQLFLVLRLFLRCYPRTWDSIFFSVIFNPIYVLNFVIFLFIGFVFYGYLFSAVGSVCTSIRDSQVLSAPVTIVLVVPIMLIVPLAMDPYPDHSLQH